MTALTTSAIIDTNKIVRLYKKGLSKKRIAKDMGCSRTYVYLVLIKAGLHKVKHDRKPAR